MALGELGCTWHIEHVPEASGVQYPPHHALGFRKLVQGALTSGRTRMVDGKQTFSSVLALKVTSRQTSHKTSGVGWVDIQKACGFECKRRTTSTITIDSNTHMN
jgi:hypothetical protein